MSEDLSAAFPTRLRSSVTRVLAHLPPSHLSPAYTWKGEVWSDGERVTLPYRVYFPEVHGAPSFTREESGVLSAIYSRHHRGTVRERHLRILLERDEAWVVPFVIQLLGEYVIEIVEVVAQNRSVLEREHYRVFAAHNPLFLKRTRQRATSYWDCYHRDRFPRLEAYPGFQLLTALARQRPSP